MTKPRYEQTSRLTNSSLTQARRIRIDIAYVPRVWAAVKKKTGGRGGERGGRMRGRGGREDLGDCCSAIKSLAL